MRRLLIAALIGALSCPAYAQFPGGQSSPNVLNPACSGGFNPFRYGTPQAWFDSTPFGNFTFVTGISQWNDKSGNARHLVQALGTAQPTYTSGINGRYAPFFIAASLQGMALTTAAMLRSVAGWSVFTVSRPNTVTTTTKIISYVSSDGGGSSRALVGVGLSTNGKMGSVARRNNADGASVLETVSTVLAGQAVITAAVMDYTNTTQLIYLKQALDNSQTALTSGSTPNDQGGLGVGGTLTSLASNWDGWIGEIIWYGSALNATQTQEMQQCLAAKWSFN